MNSPLCLGRYENIYYGNKEPGELGFDPLRLGANPTSLAYYKVPIVSILLFRGFVFD